MILPLFATAALAAKGYSGPILTWAEETGFAAVNEPTDIEVKNEGKGPANINLVAVEGIELVSLPGPFRLKPGEKLPLRVRWLEPCQDPPDAEPKCGVGRVTMSGFGGDAHVRVAPLPLDMKTVGAAVARMWWNPDGPPPPVPPPAAVMVLSNVSMELADVPEPIVLSTNRGDITIHITPPDGITPEQSTALADVLGAAYKGCAGARMKAFAREGETLSVSAAWNADGMITGVGADSGIGDRAGPYCMAQALMGQSTGINVPYEVTARANFSVR